VVCGAEMEVWRGSVNSWECDQMGHLSARYYNALVRQGLVGIAAKLGLSGAFRSDAGDTLIVTEQHLRFLGRIHDPLKQWKLSPMDLESRVRWEAYTKAKEKYFPSPAPGTPEDTVLLREIRDALTARQG